MRLLLICSLLSFQSLAQKDSADFVICQAIQKAEKPINSPPIYYFPFYNDLQLIEVDYFTYLRRDDVSRWTQPSKGLWYSNHVNSEQTNGYILRNSKGEVLKAYGILNPSGTYLLPPNEAPIITHKEHLNSEKSLFNDQSFTWKDGNGYGYRFAVSTVRPQRTEMPEMPYKIFGMLDTLGNIVLPPTHRSILYFQGEYLTCLDENTWVGNDMNAIYDSTFKKTYGNSGDPIERIGHNRYVNYSEKGGIMNHKGNYIEKYPYIQLKESHFSTDFIFSVGQGQETKYGIRSNDLTIKTKPIYIIVHPLHYGYAVMTTGSKQLAIVNMTGKQITGFDYDRAQALYNSDGTYSLLKSTNDGLKHGVIDTMGNTVIPFEYDKIHPFRYDLAIVEKNKKKGIVDRTGKVQGEIVYDQIILLDTEKIQVQIDKRIGYIDRNGLVVEPLKHTGFESLDAKFIHFTGAHESRWFVNSITNDTMAILHDEQYGKQGFARVIKNGKRGMIDRAGNFVLPCEYDLIYQFRNDGLLLVQKNGLYGLLDEELKVVEPLVHRFYKTDRNGNYLFYETPER